MNESHTVDPTVYTVYIFYIYIIYKYVYIYTHIYIYDIQKWAKFIYGIRNQELKLMITMSCMEN